MLFLCSCLFGVFISYSGASVSLKINGGMTSFQDGTKVILICTISPYNNIMTWLVDNDQYADCFLGSCGVSPNNPYPFIFNFDESNGEFRLTIESVNSTYASLPFACDDGNERKTITFDVTTGVNKPSESDWSCWDIWCIVLICFGVVCVIVLIIIVVHCRTRPKFTEIEFDDTEIRFEWTACQSCCYQKCNIACNPESKLCSADIANKRQVTDYSFRPKSTKEKEFTLKMLNSMTIYEISLSRKFCCCLATKRSVITRKSGMPNDQGYDAKSTSINVRWTKPDCITNPKYKVTCNEEVKKNKYDQTNITIKDLIPGEKYKIEVFAINKGTNSLLFAKWISTKPINVKLEDVCYESSESSVNCHIEWSVNNFDTPETFNASSNFLFNVICRTEGEQVHKKENIRDSEYTITDLNPDCSYSVDVYAIYNSRPLEPPAKIQLTPYKPTDLDYTASSTQIELKWKRPDYTKNAGNQQLQYKVTCNEGEGKTTQETSFKLENLKPSQQYDIKIFTIINGMKSLPLQEKIRTIRPQPSPPIASHSNRNNQQESFPEVPIGNVHLVAR